MFDIGGGELLLILIFVLVAFGPKKIPELSRSLGRGLREFRRAQREFTDQINTAFVEEELRSQRMPRPANTIGRRSTAFGGGEIPPSSQEPGGVSPQTGAQIPAGAQSMNAQAIDAPSADASQGDTSRGDALSGRQTEQVQGTVARGSSTNGTARQPEPRTGAPADNPSGPDGHSNPTNDRPIG